MMSMMVDLERDSSLTSLQSPVRKSKGFRQYTASSDEDDEMLASTGPGNSDHSHLGSDSSPCSVYPMIYLSGFDSISSSTASLQEQPKPPTAHNYYLK
jgi:hypothetical protein